MSNNQRERSGSNGNNDNVRGNANSPQRGFGRGSGGSTPNRNNSSSQSSTPGRGGKQTTAYRVKDKNNSNNPINGKDNATSTPLKAEAKPFSKQDSFTKEQKTEETSIKPPTIKLGPPPSSIMGTNQTNRENTNASSAEQKPSYSNVTRQTQETENDKSQSAKNLTEPTQNENNASNQLNRNPATQTKPQDNRANNLHQHPQQKNSQPPSIPPFIAPSTDAHRLGSQSHSISQPNTDQTALPSISNTYSLPPRTHSAPPNEREQAAGQQHPQHHLPFHTVNSHQSFGFPPALQFNPYFQPYYPPPYMVQPQAQPPRPVNQQFQSQAPPERKKNIIPIVNANTHQVVDVSSVTSPVKTHEQPLSSNTTPTTSNAINNSAVGVTGYGGPPPSTFANSNSPSSEAAQPATTSKTSSLSSPPDMLVELKPNQPQVKKEEPTSVVSTITTDKKSDKDEEKEKETESDQQNSEHNSDDTESDKDEKNSEDAEAVSSETETEEDSWENNANLIEKEEEKEDDFIQYPKGDFWRPNNTEGKRMYTAEFLHQFKDLCTQKPDGLPTNLIMDNTNPQGNLSRSNSFSYGKGGRNNLTHSRDRGALRSSNSSVGKGRDRLKSSTGGKKKSSSSGIHLRPEGPSELPGLSTTANKWIAQRYAPTDDESKVLRNSQLLLNKMSEENFESLSEKLLDVGIENANILEEILKRIFEKALTETKFRAMYANLCLKLSVKCPSFGPELTFKRLLLGMCQTVFEASLSEAKSERDKEKQTDKQLTKDQEEEQANLEILAKKRVVGNIHFIGELYKRQMLNDKIMHRCIQELMGDASDPHPEDVESLCVMLTNIGAQLDQGPHKQKIEVSFMYLIDVLKNKKVPSRILFMIQELIQLRKNNWVSRSEAKTQQQQKLSTSGANVPTILQRDNNRGSKKDEPKGRSAITNSTSGINLRNSNSNNNGNSLRSSQTQVSGKGALTKSSSGRNDEKGRSLLNKSGSSSTLKMDAIVQEFLQKRGDAFPIISKADQKQHPDIVSKLITVALDKETSQHSYCEQLLGLLDSLFKANVITKESLYSGYDMAIEKMDRISHESNKWIADDLGRLIAGGIVDRYLSINILQTSLSHLSQSTEIPALDVAEVVFRRLLKLDGETVVRQMMEKDRFELSSLFPKDNQSKIDDFYDQFPGFFARDQGGESNIDTIVKELAPLFEKGQRNPILNFIEELDEDMLSNPQISRAACSSFFKMVHKNSNGSSSQEVELIRNLYPAMKSFLGNPLLQSVCVEEIQKLCSSLNFPEGMMERILDACYEEGLLGRKGILEWKSNSPQTEEKKTALEQLKSFLESLE